MSHALLIIDIQNDYFPGGAMELHGSLEAGRQAGRLLEAFRRRGLPVIHVMHHQIRPGAGFLLAGTPGALIHDSVAPLEGETVIVKHYPNSFRDTVLLACLRERQIGQLTIAGMMTHMCVDTSVRAAFDLGFTCTLAVDACATRALTFGNRTVTAEDVHTAYIAALSAVFATAQDTDSVISGLT